MKIFLAILGLAAVAVALAFLWATRWSKISREALIEQYRLEDSRFMDFLRNVDVGYHGYENAGHILPIEAGEASAPDVRAFLDRLKEARNAEAAIK